MEDDLYYKAASVEPAENGEENRTFKFVASDETPDSYGDIVRAAGWELGRYKRNPIVLFGHKSDMPVGYSPDTHVEGKRLLSVIKMADKGTSDFIDTLVKLMNQRIVRAVSVGFRNTVKPNLIRDEENDRIIGFEFIGQELLENSVVSVPANPNALALAKSWGAQDRTVNRMFAEDAIVQNAIRARQLKLLALGATS